MMKKWLLTILLSLSVVAAGYIALPRYTLEQLVDAAEAENIDRLQRYIDFPALRDNLKAGVQRRLRESMDEAIPEELGELFAAGTNLFIGPILQQLVTPEGIAELLRGGKNLREFERDLYREYPPEDSQPMADDEDSTGDWHLQGWRFVDINRVSADYGGDGDTQLRLILERQGLHWRLVDIELFQRGYSGVN